MSELIAYGVIIFVSWGVMLLVRRWQYKRWFGIALIAIGIAATKFFVPEVDEFDFGIFSSGVIFLGIFLFLVGKKPGK
ncbi:MAG: hypothetical protein ACOH2R_19925 [Pseudomonas sp.]